MKFKVRFRVRFRVRVRVRVMVCSVFYNDQIGEGHAQSTIGSPAVGVREGHVRVRLSGIWGNKGIEQ